MKTSFKYFNAHPQGKNVNDCVKRAIVKATGKPYQTVSNELNKIKREIGASSYQTKAVWDKYLNAISLNVETFPAIKGETRMTGQKFCDEHPKGTYILSMAKHLTCCKNGVIYDTWSCLNKCVYTAYEIKIEYPFLEEEEDNFYYFYDEVAASPAPANEEKAVTLSEEEAAFVKEVEESPFSRMDGDLFIEKMAGIAHTDIKITKKGEPWISLDEASHIEILHLILLDLKMSTSTSSNRSKKVYLKNQNGQEFIIKSGSNPYLWYLKK